MGWKVRITAVTPQARNQTEQLATLLAKLPGVTMEAARQGLHKPPFELPAIKSESDAQKLLQGLGRMGLIGEILETGAEPVPRTVAPTPTKPPEPTSSKIDPAASKSPTRTPPPTLHNYFDKDEEEKGTRIELRETPVEKKSRTRDWGEYRTLFFAFGAILLMMAFSFTIWKIFAPKSNAETTISADQSQTAPKKKHIVVSAAVRKQERSSYEQALEQLTRSDDLLKQADETTDIRKSAEIMEKALQYNPYNLEAWRKLSDMYRRMGDNEHAEACNVHYQYSEKTQRTLEGIAKYFCGKPSAHINVARVSYQVHNDSLSAQDFHEKSADLYDTVHQLHPGKEFKVENARSNADTMRVKVTPGDTFPSMDSWEDLERKGKASH